MIWKTISFGYTDEETLNKLSLMEEMDNTYNLREQLECGVLSNIESLIVMLIVVDGKVPSNCDIQNLNDIVYAHSSHYYLVLKVIATCGGYG